MKNRSFPSLGKYKSKNEEEEHKGKASLKALLWQTTQLSTGWKLNSQVALKTKTQENTTSDLSAY